MREPELDIYVKEELVVFKQNSISWEAAKKGTVLRKAPSNAEQDAETAETQIVERQEAQEKVEKELRDKNISDERIQELEKQDANLKTEIGQLQTKKTEAEQRRDTATEEVGQEDNKKQTADRKDK